MLVCAAFSQQSHTASSNGYGPEPVSVEDVVDVRRYAILSCMPEKRRRRWLLVNCTVRCACVCCPRRITVLMYCIVLHYIYTVRDQHDYTISDMTADWHKLIASHQYFNSGCIDLAQISST